MGCWQARNEVERRVEVIDRLSQLSWPPKERSCLGSRLEPLMLNGWVARCGEGVLEKYRRSCHVENANKEVHRTKSCLMSSQHRR
jgi:hypothetical protein